MISHLLHMNRDSVPKWFVLAYHECKVVFMHRWDHQIFSKEWQLEAILISCQGHFKLITQAMTNLTFQYLKCYPAVFELTFSYSCLQGKEHKT